MRIIGGIHRSRQLLGPKGREVTRPITDRVKQSLFDRLWAMGKVGFFEGEGVEEVDLDGGNVLDLFSGTGSLGLEALSRGSARCLFIEKDRSARELLEENLEALDVGSRATILGMDALSGLWLGAVPREYRPVRVVFCDPPYQMMEEKDSCRRLVELLGLLAGTGGLIEAEGVLVIRTHGRVKAAAVAGWSGPETYAYGSMSLHFYVNGSGKDSLVQAPERRRMKSR